MNRDQFLAGLVLILMVLLTAYLWSQGSLMFAPDLVPLP